MQKYAGQLKNEQNVLKDKIIAYENENNSLDAEVNNIVEDIGNL